MVACTLVLKGARTKSRSRRNWSTVWRVRTAAWRPKANGQRGDQLTFSIAYIRDFIMNHFIIAESFETSVAWSNTLALCENVKRRVTAEHRKRELPGNPSVICRVTQLYDTGVCVYFYFAYAFKGVKIPAQVYLEIEDAARDEMLTSGRRVAVSSSWHRQAEAKVHAADHVDAVARVDRGGQARGRDESH